MGRAGPLPDFRLPPMAPRGIPTRALQGMAGTHGRRPARPRHSTRAGDGSARGRDGDGARAIHRRRLTRGGGLRVRGGGLATAAGPRGRIECVPAAGRIAGGVRVCGSGTRRRAARRDPPAGALPPDPDLAGHAARGPPVSTGGGRSGQLLRGHAGVPDRRSHLLLERSAQPLPAGRRGRRRTPRASRADRRRSAGRAGAAEARRGSGSDLVAACRGRRRPRGRRGPLALRHGAHPAGQRDARRGGGGPARRAAEDATRTSGARSAGTPDS